MQPVDARITEFIRLLSKHERSIYSYILSLVPNWADADDVFQETNVRLWSQFERYEPGTDFAAWARTVAHYMVLNFRERTGRERVHFSQAFVDAVADQFEKDSDAVPAERAALEQCIEGLPSQNRQLLSMVYGQGMRVTVIAEKLGRTVTATYKILSRIRAALHLCIRERLRLGDSA